MIKLKYLVWMIKHHTYPPSSLSEIPDYGLSHALSGFGWDSFDVTASGSMPVTTVDDQKQSELDSPSFACIKCPRYRRIGLGRLINGTVFAGKVALRIGLRQLPNQDVVTGSFVQRDAPWEGTRLAKALRAPYVLEVRDLSPEIFIQMEAIPSDSVLARIPYLLERNLATSADVSVSALTAVGDCLLHRYGISREQFPHISNGVDLNASPRVESNPIDCEFRLQNIESIGTDYDLVALIHAASIAIKELQLNLKERIVGDGPQTANLQDLIRDLRLSDFVEIASPVPRDAVCHEMTNGDALSYGVKDLPELWHNGLILNEAFDYLASAQWVIAGVHANRNARYSALVVQIYLVYPEYITKAISESASLYFDTRITLVRENREYVTENFSFPVLAEKLSAGLNRLVA